MLIENEDPQLSLALYPAELKPKYFFEGYNYTIKDRVYSRKKLSWTGRYNCSLFRNATLGNCKATLCVMKTDAGGLHVSVNGMHICKAVIVETSQPRNITHLVADCIEMTSINNVSQPAKFLARDIQKRFLDEYEGD